MAIIGDVNKITERTMNSNNFNRRDDEDGILLFVQIVMVRGKRNRRLSAG